MQGPAIALLIVGILSWAALIPLSLMLSYKAAAASRAPSPIGGYGASGPDLGPIHVLLIAAIFALSAVMILAR